jgi:hypothetical protein
MRDDYAKRGQPAKAKSHRCSHNDGSIRISPFAEIISWHRQFLLMAATPLPDARSGRAVTVLARVAAEAPNFKLQAPNKHQAPTSKHQRSFKDQTSNMPACRLIGVIAKSHFRNGGANLPVCHDDPQVVTHHFGNDFWQTF